jgi:hypothetical protein
MEKLQRPQIHSTPVTVETITGANAEKGLGRLPSIDLRDSLYRFSSVRRQLPAPAGKPRYYRHWNVNEKILPVDQGRTSACVGFSAATLIVAGPITHKGVAKTTDEANALGARIYYRALDVDEWEGDDPCCGTSVRAGMQALREFGYIESFAWGYTVDEAKEFLLSFGPVIFGTVWPDSMMRTDPNGYLWVAANSTLTGPHAAGHAYCGVGVNTRGKNPDGSHGWFDIEQSWGEGWGRDGKGKAKITFGTMATLLAAAGEVAMPTERKLKPAGSTENIGAREQ